jgi:peptidoglycan/xylan/chitin deacetylase (PgdA/CDA1 family)
MSESCPSPSRAPIPILCYHQTDEEPGRGAPNRELVLPPARFARQLRALDRMGWKGLSMQDLEPYLRGEKTGKVFGITLDDGYVNNLVHALPVLRELEFTATIFVVSDQVGGTNVWDGPLGISPVPLMDLAQLNAWTDAGMEVGAHTRNHVDLLTCNADLARDEIAGSKHVLEQTLGREVRSFCYPYGRHNSEHVEMARAAGYATASTCDSSRALASADLLRLPRLSVWRSTPLPLLLARVTTPLEEWRPHPRQRAAQVLQRWLGRGLQAPGSHTPPVGSQPQP